MTESLGQWIFTWHLKMNRFCELCSVHVFGSEHIPIKAVVFTFSYLPPWWLPVDDSPDCTFVSLKNQLPMPLQTQEIFWCRPLPLKGSNGDQQLFYITGFNCHKNSYKDTGHWTGRISISDYHMWQANRELQIWLRVWDWVWVWLFKSSLRGLDNSLSHQSCCLGVLICWETIMGRSESPGEGDWFEIWKSYSYSILYLFHTLCSSVPALTALKYSHEFSLQG